jgi:hypothetical protein
MVLVLLNTPAVNMKRCTLIAAILLSATAAFAQPAGTSKAGESRSDVRLELYRFNNFFQATVPSAEQDINAVGLEYRYAKRFRAEDEIFAHVSARKYDQSGIATSYGARLGLSHPGTVHQYRIYVDQRMNAPSFDVGNTYGQADTTTIAGEYSYRLWKKWQLGVDGDYDRQTFANRNRNNTGTELGTSLRYRGFGYKFTPGVGVYTGERRINLATESYNEKGWFVQAEVIPKPWLYLSARYTARARDYTTNVTTSSNFGRNEEHPQIALIASMKSSPRLTWLIYYSSEDVTSSRPGNDFRDSLLLIGPQYRF